MPGKIVGELLAFLLKNIPDAFKLKVKNVCVGLGYTAVQLENGYIGFCATNPLEFGLQKCEVELQSGKLAGSMLFDLARLAGSWTPVKAAVGIAAINAASQMLYGRRAGTYDVSTGNVMAELRVNPDDRVVLVGNIKPIASFLEGQAGRLYVLERAPQLRDGNVLPDAACEEYLPKANVAIITASTLVNGTLDRLLELAGNAREVVLVGASAPVTPDPLFNHGVTMVGGVRVLDPDMALRVVMEGGGSRRLREVCDLINIRPKRREKINKAGLEGELTSPEA